jgi:hypothetical protein
MAQQTHARDHEQDRRDGPDEDRGARGNAAQPARDTEQQERARGDQSEEQQPGLDALRMLLPRLVTGGRRQQSADVHRPEHGSQDSRVDA